MTTQKRDRVLPRWLSIAIFAFLVVFIVAAVLFAALQTANDHPPMGYSLFLADVEAGRITKVEQTGDTLTVSEGANRYTVVVPSILTDVYGEMQVSADRGGITLSPELYTAVAEPDRSLVALVLTGLLPLALVIIVFGFVVYILVRRGGGGPDAASRLRALDTAWKAGLITDVERDQKRTQIIEGI